MVSINFSKVFFFISLSNNVPLIFTVRSHKKGVPCGYKESGVYLSPSLLKLT